MEQIVKYDIADAAISKMNADYMGLTIQGLDDKEGFNQVHEARMVVKNHRVAVEKKRKELKADALEYGRRVDAEAKRITGLLDPIEAHLQAEEDKVIEEKKRIKEEKEKMERDRVQAIRDKIDLIKNTAIIDPTMESEAIKQKLNFLNTVTILPQVFQEFSEEAQNVLADTIKKVTAALEARIKWEKDEAERKAEAERLEKQRKEQEAAQAKINAENKRIADEKAALEREKKEAQEKKDREEREAKIREEERARAEKEAKEKVEREAREKEERERKEAEEKTKAEALKPDKDKLLMFAEKVFQLAGGNLDVKSKEARAIFHDAIAGIMEVSKKIKERAEAL
jgi:hypothetical protein